VKVIDRVTGLPTAFRLATLTATLDGRAYVTVVVVVVVALVFDDDGALGFVVAAVVVVEEDDVGCADCVEPAAAVFVVVADAALLDLAVLAVGLFEGAAPPPAVAAGGCAAMGCAAVFPCSAAGSPGRA